MPSNLEEYIEKELKKGFSLGEIKDNLIKSGHSQKRVDLAFTNFNKYEKEKTPQGSPRKVIFIFLALAAAALIISLIFMQLNGAPSYNNLMQNTTSSKPSLEMAKSYYDNKLASCLTGNNTGVEDVICNSVAERNIEQCSNSKSCELWVQIAKALDDNSASSCASLNSSVQRGICEGILSGNSEVCQSARNENERDSCIRLINGAKSALNNIENANSVCFNDDKSTEKYCKAALLKSKSVCLDYIEQDCYNYYYYELAVLQKDPSLCENITSNKESVITCKSEVNKKV